jgi:hypothetical protein
MTQTTKVSIGCPFISPNFNVNHDTQIVNIAGKDCTVSYNVTNSSHYSFLTIARANKTKPASPETSRVTTQTAEMISPI